MFTENPRGSPGIASQSLSTRHYPSFTPSFDRPLLWPTHECPVTAIPSMLYFTLLCTPRNDLHTFSFTLSFQAKRGRPRLRAGYARRICFFLLSPSSALPHLTSCPPPHILRPQLLTE